MRKTTLAIAFITILFASLTFAEIPHLISYQGILKDSSGASVVDNMYPLKFRIYNDSSGDGILWESVDYISIRTTDGKYTHVLGSTNFLPDTLAHYLDLWLGVTIGLAEEIKPRSLIINNPSTSSEPERKDSISKLDDTPQNNKILTLDPKYLGESPNNEIKTKLDKYYFKQQLTPGFILKYGVDLGGKHKVSVSGQSVTVSVKNGMTGAIEFYMVDKAKASRLGVGLEYQLPRSQSDYEGDFNFLSYYIAFRISSGHKGRSEYVTLFTFKLGHSYFSGDSNYKGSGQYEADLKGGFHFGVGLGILHSDVLLIEGIYEVNFGNIELSGDKFDIKYSRFYISMGINSSSK